MSDILKPKKQYKKRQTKQEIIDEYKGGFIDEPRYSYKKEYQATSTPKGVDEPTYEPVYNDPTSVDELVELEEKQFPKVDEELMKPVKRGRGAMKGQLSDKLKQSLAQGREKLKEKWEQDKIKNKELSDMYAIKRANKIIQQQLKLKQKMHCEDLDDEPEEVIKVIQPKKAPKKKTIILEPISDSEEEIIVRK
jgi:hypothetical protein